MQNRAFATKLLAICTRSQRSHFLAEHKFGVNRERFQASESDGIAIYWTILQLYRPLDRDYRRRLEKEIIDSHLKFRVGKGDPMEALKSLQMKHREALDIMLRIKWDQCAIPLISQLATRDALFTVKLADFRSLPADPDDSAVELGALLTEIGTVIETLNDTAKNWSEGSARVATESKGGNKDIQRLEEKISRLDKALAAYPKKGSRPSHSGTKTIKPGFCQAKGCSAKIVGYTPSNLWKVCGTCLLKCKETGNEIKLVNGDVWGARKKAKAMLATMQSEGIEPSESKVHSAKKRKELEEDKPTKVKVGSP